MTTWTKIEPNIGRAGGRAALEYPRITRVQGGITRLRLPPHFGFVAGEKVDVFYDGADAVAFVKGGSSYIVSQEPNHSPTVGVTVPAALAKRLPIGTTRCKLSVIENGVILDMSQFAPKAAPVAATRNPFTSVAAE